MTYTHDAGENRALSFTFDAAGQMISAADPSASYIFGHDHLGRETSVTCDLAGLSFNVDLLSTYNSDGDRTWLEAAERRIS